MLIASSIIETLGTAIDRALQSFCVQGKRLFVSEIVFKPLKEAKYILLYDFLQKSIEFYKIPYKTKTHWSS